MGHIGIAVVVGALAGLVAGARPGAGSPQPLRLPWVLAAGIATSVFLEAGGARGDVALAGTVVASLCLLTGAVVNLRLAAGPGMAIIVLGLTLNLTSMVVHGGMPVDGDALVTAGVVPSDQVSGVDLGSRRHLATAADRLPALGDVVPVAPLGQVLSVGDLLLAGGLALVIFRLVHPPPAAPAPAPVGPGRGGGAVERG